MKTKIFSALFISFLAASASAQDRLLPENPELYNPDPDGCVDTIGEIIDRHAESMGLDGMLLRNMYWDNLQKAIARTQANPNTKPEDIIMVPGFNEKLSSMSEDVAALLGVLAEDPTVAYDYFGDGCDLEV